MILNWREGLLLVLGILFFLVIIAGLVLNTIFLVREIRRNEQHDTFINAVTHELKTPWRRSACTCRRCSARDLDDGKRQEFYKVMVEDSDRLLRHRRAGAARRRARCGRARDRMPVDLGRSCANASIWRARATTCRTRRSIYRECASPRTRRRRCWATRRLRAAVSNLLDNAIKYSGPEVHVAVELDAPEAAGSCRARARPRASASRRRSSNASSGASTAPGHRRRLGSRARVSACSSSDRSRAHGGKVFAESAGPGTAARSPCELPAVCHRHEPNSHRRRRTPPGGRTAVQPRGGESRRRVVESGEAALERLTADPAHRCGRCST